MARILILGAGFGGLELSTRLSEALGDAAEVTLIDKSDSFVFGYSKLDLMFAGASPEAVRLPYADFVHPGVRLLRETITAIDPEARRVTTDAGVHEADHLVIALGADYDLDATPGLAELDSQFYSVEGAERLAPAIAGFSSGRALIGVCGAPYKCPPAPGECALLLDAELRRRGVREACEIVFSTPLPSPLPPSPEASAAFEAEFEQRGIELRTGAAFARLDPARKLAVFKDGAELAFDLFLGVPKHRAPDVVLASGLAEDGYVPVDPVTLATKVPGVWAIGDVAELGVPKAGAFAEGGARTVAEQLLAAVAGGPPAERYRGQGICYIEFGEGRIGSVDIDFLSGPERRGTFNAPSAAQMARKERFGAERLRRWFGR